MLHKTRGIVFRYTRYGESSIIVNIFTELFGLQSYIVNGVRGSSSKKNKIALFQPLTLLDLVIYHRENANILRIREVSCAFPYHSLMQDVRKTSIALFLNEILNKTVKEQSHSQEIFSFLFSSLSTLDLLTGQVENFHLVFLVRLSRFLGFGVNSPHEISGGAFGAEDDEKIIQRLISSDYQANLALTSVQRRNILDLLVRFYATHVDHFGELKSIQVLREVLR